MERVAPSDGFVFAEKTEWPFPGRALRLSVFMVVLLFLRISPLWGQGLITREKETQLRKKLEISHSDTGRIEALLALGKFHLYKQAKLKTDLDSASRYLDWAKRLSDSLKILKMQHESESMLVLVMLNQGQLDMARVREERLVKECERTGELASEANARFRYAMFLTSSDSRSREGMSNLLAAADIYKKVRLFAQEVRIRYQIAFIHFNEGNTALAEKELLSVLDQYKAIKYPKLHYTYNLLATLYRIKGDFDKGIKYAILSIDCMNKTQDTARAAYFYGDLARIYMEIGDQKNAIEWYKKAVNKWERQKLPEFGLYLAEGYIAGDIIAQKMPGDALSSVLTMEKNIPPVSLIQQACMAEDKAYCYDALHQFSVAEKYYRQSVMLYDSSKMNFEVPQEAKLALGRFYVKRTDYNEAGKVLRQTLMISPQKLSLAAVRDVHFMLYKVDSAQKNYLTALDHFRIQKALNDSLFNRTKIREIEQLLIQFETEKKDREFKLLNNQNKLQEVKLQQAKQRQNVTFGGALLLLLIFALVLNQYRLKQRSNKQLQLQQAEIRNKNANLQSLVTEKEWLVKEIHHRVKNNLQTIVSLLESQTAFLNNNDALAAVRDSQHRIHAMSLIHQRLYLVENVTTIQMQGYIKELVNYLSESFDSARKINFKLEIYPIELDVAMAIPLGLILNEAITNSIKYAFPNGRGTIMIEFRKSAAMYSLEISDDGIGLPQGFDENAKSQSLGMTLIKGLCKEIGAEFKIKGSHGTIIYITFPLVSFKNRFTAN